MLLCIVDIRIILITVPLVCSSLFQEASEMHQSKVLCKQWLGNSLQEEGMVFKIILFMKFI